MTARNFFNIVLKIFGLFFLREIINSVPQLISTLFFLFKPENFAEGLFLFVASCLVLTFYIVLTYQLLFRTNNLVDKLKLDRDFNDIIFEFKLPKTEILTISLIIIGGIILLNEIPNLCKSIFLYIQEKKINRGMTKPDFTYIILSLAKVTIALLLIGERVRIVELFSRKSKTEISED